VDKSVQKDDTSLNLFWSLILSFANRYQFIDTQGLASCYLLICYSNGFALLIKGWIEQTLFLAQSPNGPGRSPKTPPTSATLAHATCSTECRRGRFAWLPCVLPIATRPCIVLILIPIQNSAGGLGCPPFFRFLACYRRRGHARHGSS